MWVMDAAGEPLVAKVRTSYLKDTLYHLYTCKLTGAMYHQVWPEDYCYFPDYTNPVTQVPAHPLVPTGHPMTR